VSAYTQAVSAGRKPAGQAVGTGTVAGGGSAGELFGNDDDVMCLVEIPAQYKTITKRVLKTPAATREIDVPAEYVTVRKQVADTAAGTREIAVAGQSSTYTRRVVDMDALYKAGYKLSADGNALTDGNGNTLIPVYDAGAEKGTGAGGRSGGNRRADASASGSSIIGYNREIEVPGEFSTVTRQVVDQPASQRAIAIPAEFKTVTRQVIDQPASVREIDVPAEYKTVSRQVIDQPALVREVEVPAEYRTVRVQKVVEAATERVVDVPAQMGSLSRSNKVADGVWGWRSILCETNATQSRIQNIQRALKVAGYDPGPIDGVIRQQTMRAVNAYQSAKGLPVDPYLNTETVKSLGVDPS
jgi:Putative peptidoglycan binding domain